jgi:hypothetical protein
VHPVENPNPLWHVMPPAAGPASVGTASPLLELLLGREVAAAEEFADQDREPNLNLVEPRGVLGREGEGDAMTGIAQERHEVGFGAGIPDGAEDFAVGNIERGDQGFRAIPDVLELPPFDVSKLHRQTLGSTCQRLNTDHLVDRDSLHALLGGGGGGGCLMHRTDIGTLGVEVGIKPGVSQ